MTQKYVKIPEKYIPNTDSLYHYFDNLVSKSNQSGFLKQKKTFSIDLNSYLNKFPHIDNYLLITNNINLKSSYDNINISLWFYLDIDANLYFLNNCCITGIIINNIQYKNNIITFDINTNMCLLHYYVLTTNLYGSNITFSNDSTSYNINNNILSIRYDLWKETSKILGIAKENNKYFIYPIKK